MRLSVKVQQPRLALQMQRLRVRADLVPVRLVPLLARRDAGPLGARDAFVADLFVGTQRQRHVGVLLLFRVKGGRGALFQADGKRDAVFHGLAGALDRGGEEGVGGVPDEGNARFGGDEGRQWVSIDQFVVDELVGWGCFDDVLRHGIPAFQTS